MLVKLSGIYSDQCGKLGGSAAARNAAGLYLKNFKIPHNPRTPYQSTERNNFKAMVLQWQYLPYQSQQDWNKLASSTTRTNRVGDSYHPSGQNIFLSCNQNLFMVGRPALLSAPVLPSIPQFTKVSAVLTSFPSSFTLILSGGVLNSNIFYHFSISRPQSLGKNYLTVQIPQIGFINDSLSSFTYTSAQYLTRFNITLVSGKSYFVRVVPIDIISGFSGLPLTNRFIF